MSNRTINPLILTVVSLLLLTPPTFAQTQQFDSEKDVPVEFLASANGVGQGASMDIAVRFKVPSGYHISSLETGLVYVEFDSLSGLAVAPAQFPKGYDYKGNTVYGGEIIVRSTITAASNASTGSRELKAKIGYQICVEVGTEQCFLPVEKVLTLAFNILPAGTSPTPSHSDVFQNQSSNRKVEAKSDIKPAPSSTGFAGAVEGALQRGSWLALFLVFIGGILSSFTPCVYPIIPITISYIGGRAQGKRLRGFVLSLFFTLGLALMYSSLGVIAAMTGGVFGGLTQHPAVYITLIIIFIAMGASMMGAFDLQLPASWQGKLQSGKKSGVGGAIAMGMVSGLIAAPCVGPILVALLTWVAKSGSILIGFGILFTYSVGMGMLFIVIGTFAGAMASLPKAGGWMDGVKHFFGWLLWGTAIYFAGVMIPGSWKILLWGVYLSLLGTYVGAFLAASEDHEWKWIMRKWFGILSITTGLFLFVLGLSQIFGLQIASGGGSASVETKESAPAWIVNDPEGVFAKAASDDKPVMMDFYADWCVACVELDKNTYNQSEVLTRAEKFLCLKMDFTRQNDWSKQMTQKYQVKGMPTVIFFTPKGEEIERFTGFKEPKGVAEIMDRALAASK
jgi:thioredoxin:protein disulfide reductase